MGNGRGSEQHHESVLVARGVTGAPSSVPSSDGCPPPLAWKMFGETAAHGPSSPMPDAITVASASVRYVSSRYAWV
ncbi:hypothetical protein [Sinomonas atrocyanea]|uniref:hypothetical protein n=1 Tax=Sinomonas atrocyanea TaxID=37927 RepID=UPI003D98B46C